MVTQLAQKFNKDELLRLVDDKNSCVKIHKSVYSLQLYPYHLTDISTSIKELLNAKVAKYDQKLDGILLGYANLKLLTPQGSIICDSCFIHIDIEGDFYIFKPKVDSLLTGTVNKKSVDHVGCLVHQLFNISVPSTEDNRLWTKVQVGDEVVLKIVYMDLESRLPYFKAELTEIKTKKKNKQLEEDSTPKKKRKRDKSNLEDSILENNNTDELDTSIKKKNKKIKLEETNNIDLNKPVSKKKRKEKLQVEELLNNNTSHNELNKKKKIKKEIEIKTEVSEVQEELVENGREESINNSSHNESLGKKKKKKPILKEDTELTSEGNLNDSTSKKKKRKFKEEKVQENGFSEEILMRPTEMIKQAIDESPKKGRKRDEPKKRDSLLNPTPKVMADLEDRKHKKLNSTKNILWDNKELDLYDPELEQTLNEKADESTKFNLVKISALNEGVELKSEEKKKKKRKSGEGKNKNEKLNFEDKSTEQEIKKIFKKKSMKAK